MNMESDAKDDDQMGDIEAADGWDDSLGSDPMDIASEQSVNDVDEDIDGVDLDDIDGVAIDLDGMGGRSVPMSLGEVSRSLDTSGLMEDSSATASSELAGEHGEHSRTQPAILSGSVTGPTTFSADLTGCSSSQDLKESKDTTAIPIGTNETVQVDLPEKSLGPSEQDIDPSEGAMTDVVQYQRCYNCGFDLPPRLSRYTRIIRGPQKGRVPWRMKCVRRKCQKFFGSTYLLDGKEKKFVLFKTDTALETRQFASGPREEKFDQSEYDQCVQEYKRRGKSTILNDQLVSTSAASAPSVMEDNPAKNTKRASPNGKILSNGSATVSSVEKITPPRKKMRKGYAFIALDESLPTPDSIDAEGPEGGEAVKRIVHREEARPPCRSFATQTGETEHGCSLVIDEIRSKTAFSSFKPGDSATVSDAIARRLLLTQQTLIAQGTKIRTLREENQKLSSSLTIFGQSIRGFCAKMMDDMRRLRDDIECGQKDLKTFSDELRNEATKDMRLIKGIKESVAKKLDNVDRYKRKIQVTGEYQERLAKQADETVQHYHRMVAELEQKLMVAKKTQGEAETKLNDKIYIANNARCTHCTVTEKVKGMLTNQVAELMKQRDATIKEKNELQKRVDNTEQVNRILSKNNDKTKFELRAWEANCLRLTAEVAALKEAAKEARAEARASNKLGTPSSATGHGDAVCSPAHSVGGAAVTPATPASDEPAETDGTGEMEKEEGEIIEGSKETKSSSPSSLSQLPPPPAPPAEGEVASSSTANPFANWIPKAKKTQEAPEYIAALNRVQEKLKRVEEGGTDKEQQKESVARTHPLRASESADSKKPNPGLVQKKGEEKGKPNTKQKVTEAKNAAKVASPAAPSVVPPSEKQKKNSAIQPSVIAAAKIPKKMEKLAKMNSSAANVAVAPSKPKQSAKPVAQKATALPPRPKPTSVVPESGKPIPTTAQRRPPQTASPPVYGIASHGHPIPRIGVQASPRPMMQPLIAPPVAGIYSQDRHPVYHESPGQSRTLLRRDRRDYFAPIVSSSSTIRSAMDDFDPDLPWNQTRRPEPETWLPPPRPRTPTMSWDEPGRSGFYDDYHQRHPAMNAPPPQSFPPHAHEWGEPSWSSERAYGQPPYAPGPNPGPGPHHEYRRSYWDP